MSSYAFTGYYLIVGSSPYIARRMHKLIVAHALKGSLRWIVCGRYLDLYRLTYDLARRTPRYYDILKNNIMLTRAETCYQVAGILQRLKVSCVPTLVTDLLTGFFDQGVPDTELDTLLFESIQALRRLSKGGVVIASAAPNAGRMRLFEALKLAAAAVEQLPATTATQCHQ